MAFFSLSDLHLDRVALGEHSFRGWIRTHRTSKKVSFVEVTDGTAVRGLQIVCDAALPSYVEIAPKLTTGASIIVHGNLVESPAKGQKYEFQASQIELIGEADPELYPLQKKGHSLEFLRENLHLRPRTNTMGAVLRLRSKAAFAVHRFFHDRGFYYVHTPIISTSDCEGAGHLFRVTTLDAAAPPLIDGKVDFGSDFFKKEASLTVSGQLEAEACALGISKVYTFGPTFRAENSNTTRHLAEFWMIEPEMAFFQLEDNMELAEDFVRTVIRELLETAAPELEFLSQIEGAPPAILDTLASVAGSKFERLDYTDAIKILEKAPRSFEYPISWGVDLQTEHERYLTDEHVKGPVIVVNYPKEIKSFYMRLNEDHKTVRAMDVLVPRLGEIIGGSQREERYDVLEGKMKAFGLDVEMYSWYLDLHGPTFWIRLGVRAASYVCLWHGEYPRCRAVSALSGVRGVLRELQKALFNTLLRVFRTHPTQSLETYVSPSRDQGVTCFRLRQGELLNKIFSAT
jgi:asparaginyl-tRNA synthetase